MNESDTYYKKAEKEGENRTDLVENEKLLYERIIQSKDEMIEMLKTQIEILKK